MNLLRALATVSGMTLISRILGFVRDTVIAGLFGAGLQTDAFFVAFRLPNLLRRLFAEGAFSQAFVPILGEYRNKRGSEETRRLIDHVASVLAMAVTLVTLLGIALAPLIVYVTAPGFSEDPVKFDLTVVMLRITFPYILCISLVALAAGVLNTWNRFAVPAITPVLLNVSMIVAALFATRWFETPVIALAWGVCAGGVLQLALQLPFVHEIGMLPRTFVNIAPSLADPGVRRVLKQMGPAVIGVSIGQISLVINTIFASFLQTGSVSWLYYADRLMEFPSGVLGVALGTILLPSLSKHHANSSDAEYSQLLDWGLRLTLLLALPAAIALALLAVPLISTLFQYHRFTAGDVVMTQQALVAYSLGLTALIVVKVLAPGYYARQNIRTPVKIAIATLAVTQLMNLAFVPWLKHAGLALSIGLGACFNAWFLLSGLKSRGIYSPQPGWPAFSFKLLVALAAMSLTLWFTAGDAAGWLQAAWTVKVPRLALTVTAGAATYFLTLWLLGFRPADFSKRGA
jgi:putative peptidoglycan lipid II flippase